MEITLSLKDLSPGYVFRTHFYCSCVLREIRQPYGKDPSPGFSLLPTTEMCSPSSSEATTLNNMKAERGCQGQPWIWTEALLSLVLPFSCEPFTYLIYTVGLLSELSDSVLLNAWHTSQLSMSKYTCFHALIRSVFGSQVVKYPRSSVFNNAGTCNLAW